MFRHFQCARLIAAVPLAVALAICAAGAASGAPVITRTGTTPFYSPTAVMMAKRDGALPAQVRGRPSPGANEAGTVAPLRLPASVGGGRVVAADPERTGGTRMVLVFNGEGVSPEQACEAPSNIRTGPAGKGLDVYAVLCRGNDYFSHAHLRDEAVRSVRDAHYANAMEQLLLALMPTEERADDDLD